jgi:hypothetical protein
MINETKILTIHAIQFVNLSSQSPTSEGDCRSAIRSIITRLIMSRFIDHNTFSALPVEGTPEQEVKVKKRRDRKHVHQHTKSNNSAASLQNNKTNAHIDASKTLAEHSLARPYSLKAKKITEQTKLKSELPGELPVKLKRQVSTGVEAPISFLLSISTHCVFKGYRPVQGRRCVDCLL